MHSTQRRRSFHRRSKNGCQTCKQRHLRCDEKAPKCLNCERRNLLCMYPTLYSGSIIEKREPLLQQRDTSLARILKPMPRIHEVGWSSPYEAQKMAIRNPMATELVLANASGSMPSPNSGSNSHITTGESLASGRIPRSSVPSRASPTSCTLPDVCELCSEINYRTPLISGLTYGAVEILHLYQNRRTQIMVIPPFAYQKSVEDYRSILLPIACQHDFVKHSLVYLSAMFSVQYTGRKTSRDIAATYLDMALRGLQQAINNFTPQNADAIISASKILCLLSPNWREWTSFVAGWSAVIYHMKNGNHPITSHELMSPNFWLKLSQPESVQSLPSILIRRSSKFRVQSVYNSIIQIKEIISNAHWQAFGFKELEALTLRLQDLDTCLSVESVFSKLMLLRMWMFAIEIGDYNRDSLLGKLMKVHFYILLLAVQPYFPSLCSTVFERVCRSFIQEGRKDFENVSPQMRELAGILWNVEIIIP